MFKYATILLLCAVVSLGGAFAWQSRTVTNLKADNASMARSVKAFQLQAEQSALARAVEESRAKAAATRNAILSKEIETILSGDIPDAPLHPDLILLLNGGDVRPD